MHPSWKDAVKVALILIGWTLMLFGLALCSEWGIAWVRGET